MKKLQWKKPIQGTEGHGEILNEKNEWILVHWKKDSDGIWIQFPNQVFGFNFHALEDESSNKIWNISRRLSYEEYELPQFIQNKNKLIAEKNQNTSGKNKKIKIRTQMPGKIIKIKIQLNDLVQKGQPLIVMEAMKMENEIISSVHGKIIQIECQEGQTLESGATIIWIDPISA